MSRKASLIQTSLLFCVYTIIALAIRAYSHLIALRLIGVEGFISSFALGKIQFAILPPPSQRFIIGVAGGLGVILIFTFLYLLDIDPENRFIFGMWIGHGFIRGVFEAIAMRDFNMELSDWGNILSTLFAVVYLLVYIAYQKIRKK